MEKHTNTIIDAIIKAEGGSKFTDDPHDKGGRTQYGISERSNPEAWRDGRVTEEEARAIYYKRYVSGPGFDKITDPKLQHFLCDFAVHSGPGIAIKYLQRAIDVEDDGVLGPRTLAAVNAADARHLVNRLVVDRVKMIGRLVVANPSQLKYLNGWLNRILEFLL
jgi:lysozyme family protein